MIAAERAAAVAVVEARKGMRAMKDLVAWAWQDGSCCDEDCCDGSGCGGGGC